MRNSSDGLVETAYASGAAGSGVIPSRVKPMTLKLAFATSLLDAQHCGTVWVTSRQVHSLCRWERHLAKSPFLRVKDRWPATPKRGCDSALIAFSW